LAVPKRKTSKARRNKRRANWKLALPGFSVCPRCRETKLAHRICPNCGYYKDKEVIK
jgi:large subunit ribosomal protein L32